MLLPVQPVSVEQSRIVRLRRAATNRLKWARRLAQKERVHRSGCNGAPAPPAVQRNEGQIAPRQSHLRLRRADEADGKSKHQSRARRAFRQEFEQAEERG